MDSEEVYSVYAEYLDDMATEILAEWVSEDKSRMRGGKGGSQSLNVER